MKFLAVHPGPLMYTKVFLRLEPLGLELVANAARMAGHDVGLIDLQVEDHAAYYRLLDDWRPEAVAFGCNYLANVPEIIDLAKATKLRLPNVFVFVGGHSASFITTELLEHAEGAIDCVLKGEGEAGVVTLLEAAEHDRGALKQAPGAVTLEGEGPAPKFVASLDDVSPARDLLRHRRKYFIGMLDPCASIEFTRGCPWDCSFCSAWTFYGRSYRAKSPEKIVEDLERIKEPGVFIVDDVAFVQEKSAFEIGEAIARKGIKKKFYIETRSDVLLRNKEAFKLWRSLGAEYMFIGLEAVDEEGLKKFRKRTPLRKNFEALEFVRSQGFTVAVNLIVDPDWDKSRFEAIRKWCLEVPEIVSLSINTPYPGTENWHTESRSLTTNDYRLFDIQHAVLPTKMPLAEFYEELVKTQQILNMKHMGWQALKDTSMIVAGQLMRGQTNFLKMLWKFSSVYDPKRMLADHHMPVVYDLAPRPPFRDRIVNKEELYIHKPPSRKSRAIDGDTEAFIKQSQSSD